MLLDLAGKAHWEKQLSESDLGPSHGRAFGARVGDDGHVLLTVGGQQRLVDPAGAEEAVTDVGAAAGPFPAGVLPVGRPASGVLGFDPTSALRGGIFGWRRPGGALDETGFAIEDGFGIRRIGDEMVFFSRTMEGAHVVVHARPDALSLVPVPPELSEARLTGLGTGVWQLYDFGVEVVRFNLATGQSARVISTPPDGTRRFGPPDIDVSGSLMAAFRNDHIGGVYRFVEDESRWSPFGRTFTQVEELSLQARGATFLVKATSTRSRFVPTQMWSAAPPGDEPDLGGGFRQLLRPADGLALTVSPARWDVELSEDGLCAVYWPAVASGTPLVVHDVLADTTATPLSTPARAYAVAWIE